MAHIAAAETWSIMSGLSHMLKRIIVQDGPILFYLSGVYTSRFIQTIVCNIFCIVLHSAYALYIIWLLRHVHSVGLRCSKYDSISFGIHILNSRDYNCISKEMVSIEMYVYIVNIIADVLNCFIYASGCFAFTIRIYMLINDLAFWIFFEMNLFFKCKDLI